MAQSKIGNKKKNAISAADALALTAPKNACIVFGFRFLNKDHHSLVKKAADLAGLSMNTWLVQVTLSQAREELRCHSAQRLAVRGVTLSQAREEL